jgi:hypothetical protein
VIPLSKASNKAKTKWNASHYAQIKVSVRPEVASAFKAACDAAGISMASALSAMMTEYAGVADTNQDIDRKTTSAVDPVSTMNKRRKTARAVTHLLEQVRDAEERFIGNAPENLKSAPIYEIAEQYVSVLEDVIEQLGEIY